MMGFQRIIGFCFVLAFFMPGKAFAIKRDPYLVLGVPSTASKDEIDTAHRSLVKKYYPDWNDNKREIVEKFTEVNDAYDLVGDETKKAAYDQSRRALAVQLRK